MSEYGNSILGKTGFAAFKWLWHLGNYAPYSYYFLQNSRHGCNSENGQIAKFSKIAHDNYPTSV